MKKNYFLVMMLLFGLLTNAQGAAQNDIKQKATTNSQVKKSTAATTTFSDIKYWVGTGANQAAFVVQWNDGKNTDALIWGFKWDGNATGEDMLKAIAKADRRFFSLLYPSAPGGGTEIGGLGFDLNGVKSKGLYKDANLTYPLYPSNGIINTGTYDFDQYVAIDADDHWQSGWTNGKWSYSVKEDTDSDFSNSVTDLTKRTLKNGSWDVWNYKPKDTDIPVASTFIPVTPYVTATDFSNGFFIVNEDWFGRENGSVNFVNNNGDINYRVYSTANNNEALGVTAQYGTIYGDKFYFISKQAGTTSGQYTPGGRLVVANAQNMQRIAKFDVIGGDGRSFVGVNENTGYIGTLNGIYLFDISTMKVGNLIAGTAGQIGNMIRTSQYVFAAKQTTGILVIDPATNTIIKTISGAFNSVVQAKDGSVWGILNQKLIRIDAVTFETTEYAIPATTKYTGSWGAWNAGSFTYSNQQNSLYWLNGAKIVKFDIDSKIFNENFVTIPGQTATYKQVPYGAALRIDPVSDNLIVNTTENGYGAHYQKNWIHTFDNSGNLINTKILDDYYWFPALTVFTDNAAPVVNTTLPSKVAIKDPAVIDLKTVVNDTDNLSLAIVKSVKSNNNIGVVSATINTNDELVLTPSALGNATVVISFNSNGKVVEKSIEVTVTNNLGTGEFTKLKLAIYPNPVAEILNIQTEDEILNVTVYDVSGKSIQTRVDNNQINVSNFTNGLYIINVVTDKANYVQKFIKK
ncbi:DUF5074 domain-containing protein [Flavobacterium sp.]|uniref:T9SS type A sorting domain-containing protein n=1 Tax=Flavobacterium sp. TaxID=239 RepID=UPI003D109207